MKLIVLACLIAVASAQYSQHRDIIQAVNGGNGATWTAGINERFIGYSLEDVKAMLGTYIDTTEEDMLQDEFHGAYQFGADFSALPDSFDARDVWPQCKDIISNIRDQAKCGSCWAHGAAEALSDRFCIHSNGTQNLNLGPQSLVSCSGFPNQGCNGGILGQAWGFMKNHGVATEECFPYVSGDGHVPKCPSTCEDGSSITWYHAKNYAKVAWFFNRAEKIQAELLKNGPIEVGYTVYEDFMHYKSGVYSHVTGSQLGGHAVKLIGWGVENGTPYWLINNSWGSSWGDNGTFKIKRGSNECGIEGQAYAGLPQL